MTKAETAKLKRLVAKIEKAKVGVAKYRDELRETQEDLEHLVGHLNAGIAGLTHGCRTILDGIDEMGQTI